jgi:hypothetical protein
MLASEHSIARCVMNVLPTCYQHTCTAVICHVVDLVQADGIVATTHVAGEPSAASGGAFYAGAIASDISQVEGTPAGVMCDISGR